METPSTIQTLRGPGLSFKSGAAAHFDSPPSQYTMIPCATCNHLWINERKIKFHTQWANNQLLNVHETYKYTGLCWFSLPTPCAASILATGYQGCPDVLCWSCIHNKLPKTAGLAMVLISWLRNHNSIYFLIEKWKTCISVLSLLYKPVDYCGNYRPTMMRNVLTVVVYLTHLHTSECGVAAGSLTHGALARAGRHTSQHENRFEVTFLPFP